MGISRLVLATRNQGKLREIAELLGDLEVEVLSLDGFPDMPDIEEPFESFAENAAHKAIITAREVGERAMADDSGLMVDALDGAPGVRSSRIAPSDPERIAWVLEELEGVPLDERQARFVCAIALASPAGLEGQWEETVEGVITETPRGSEGFGFDPVFHYPPARKTFAEMSQQEKSAVSHRGKALRAFRKAIAARDLGGGNVGRPRSSRQGGSVTSGGPSGPRSALSEPY